MGGCTTRRKGKFKRATKVSTGHCDSPTDLHDFNRSRNCSSGVVLIWGFPKIRGTIFGVPIIRIIVYWGLYWSPLI